MTHNILIIEDEEDIAESLAMRLKHEEVTVQTCSKLNDALFKLRNQRFSCIILDLHLKQGSGEDILKDVRNDAKHANYDTPIFLTTGSIDKRTFTSMRDGLTAVYIKPYDSQEIVKKIFSILHLED